MRKNLPIILLSALVVIGLLVGVGYYFQTYRHGKAAGGRTDGGYRREHHRF